MFIIFAGMSYYPAGGMLDMKGTFPTQEAAMTALANMSSIDWWQIAETTDKGLQAVSSGDARLMVDRDQKAATVPFYERSLNSFDDTVITKARPSREGGGWYATLDTGRQRWPSDPDFVRYNASEQRARAACARAIRDDAQGIGKYAPHALLCEDYDLRFRLMKHWADKEAVGHPERKVIV